MWDATYATLPPASVTQSGNRYLFAYQPTLTVTTTNVTKTYGVDATASVAAAYGISGYQAGVANAFLGDTSAATYAGTPSVTSSGSAGTANVSGSPYAITAAAGSLTALDGYTLAFNNAGQLTINPAALHIQAVSDTKVYDGTNVSSATPTYDGLVAGDSLTGLTEVFGGHNVSLTVMQVTAYTLSDPGNYTVTEGPAIGQITAAALHIQAVSDSKVYDGTNVSSATPTYTGLVAGDSLTGLTEVFGGHNVGLTVMQVTAYTLSDPGNYTVTEGPAIGQITPAALTITASDQSKTYGQTLALGTTAFTTGTLYGSDTVTGVTLTSAGAVATANVGIYTITPSSALGSGLGNYTISYVNAPTGLTVNPATLTVATAGLTGTVVKDL